MVEIINLCCDGSTEGFFESVEDFLKYLDSKNIKYVRDCSKKYEIYILTGEHYNEQEVGVFEIKLNTLKTVEYYDNEEEEDV